MEIFSALPDVIETNLLRALSFIFVITVIVFFHELGHFMMARWVGVDVETFSVGFGPEIFGFNDSRGTRWRLSWIPLGGYVKFLGDENAASVPDREKLANMSEEQRSGSFEHKSLPRRAAVVAAGPAANFLLTIVIFAATLYFMGRTVTAPIVDEISPGGAAEAAGFAVGDDIKSIDGSEIESFSDLIRIVSISAGRTLSIVVERDGELVTLSAVPDAKETPDITGVPQIVGRLGIIRHAQGDRVVEELGLVDAVSEGVEETWNLTHTIVTVLSRIVTGEQSAKQLGGPLRIAQVSGEVANISIIALINLAAALSVSIGLINLFPIPMLDGGHLLYYAIEAVRGKPLSDKIQDIGFRVGLVLVISLMIFVTWNDLDALNVF